MPYNNERATGDSLWRLEENESVRQFKGVIRTRNPQENRNFPPVVSPPRRQKIIRRIIAIDGSSVTMRVQNGFPKAEAALFNAAVILIKIDELLNFETERIPSPRQLRDLEKVYTMSAVLPGPNVTGTSQDDDTPKKFFRSTVRKEMNFRLDPNHESLLETFLDITGNVSGQTNLFKCPIEDCEKHIARPRRNDLCSCSNRERIYPTDSLRMHERFYDNSSSEQAFTAFRMVIEHLLLVNILRYFKRNHPPSWFDEIAFVVDGPLAIFGMPAWLKEHVQNEIADIHNDLVSQGHAGLLLMGMEKSGEFLDHLEELDWHQTQGRRQKLPNSTAMAPTTEYIYQHITPNPNTQKPYGAAVYFGRKVLYKNRSGQHAVVMTPIVNPAGRIPNGTELAAFPRLGEVLDIVDDLYTHLYQDGFIPLIRANAHAAIPLRQGQRILANLFDENSYHPQ